MNKYSPRICEGAIRVASTLKAWDADGNPLQVRAGMIIPCPRCGKPVKLTIPFNAAATGYYVQYRRHNHK